VMRTHWEDLVMVNYEVNREWVQQFVPKGCELELFKGRAIVTVVAFKFRKTRIMRVKVPFYNDFAEINLRIYVRRKDGVGQGERGVVFIKELIEHKLPAIVANVVFKENFEVMPVMGGVQGQRVEYLWGNVGDGQQNRVEGEFDGELKNWRAGGEEEFVGENYFAYKDMGRGKTLQFEVRHEPWRMRKLKEVKVEIDIAALYGEEWAENMCENPRGVFYVDGNEVGVTLPMRCSVIREVDTLEDFIKHKGQLHCAVVQGLDLSNVELDWEKLDFNGAVFLGCDFPKDVTVEFLVSRGAVMFPMLPDLPYNPIRVWIKRFMIILSVKVGQTQTC